MPEELSCLESCHALQSLVITFPRGTHYCVTKLGAVWDCWSLSVELTVCQVSEMEVYSHFFVCLLVYFPLSPLECFVQSHRSEQYQ